MSVTFTVEDYIKQRLGDRDLEDYFAAADEMTDIIWRSVVCRSTRLTLSMLTIEQRGSATTGTFWAYATTQYTPNIFQRVLACCSFDQLVHQPNHKYALFQANAYVDDVFAVVQPDIDEIVIAAEFTEEETGAVALTGYPLNLNRVMYDIFTAIADDEGKLAIYQSTLGGSTDLRVAAREAQRRAGNYLRGTMIAAPKLKGLRR